MLARWRELSVYKHDILITVEKQKQKSEKKENEITKIF